MDTAIAFRLWGDYAHFKKHYTTTSPLTFEIPPPPTLVGMISAIIGLDKNEYLSKFNHAEDFQIAVCIDKPIKKVRWTQNLIDTKRHFWKIHNRTQIRTEFLKDPCYTIYFSHKNKEIYDQLKENLRHHQSVYSISLGLSELLANFEYLGEFKLTKNSDKDWIDLNSVLPYSELVDDHTIDFGLNKEIFKVNYPIFMEPDRVVSKREDILFERKAQTIRCKLKQFWNVDNGAQIVFF